MEKDIEETTDEGRFVSVTTNCHKIDDCNIFLRECLQYRSLQPITVDKLPSCVEMVFEDCTVLESTLDLLYERCELLCICIGDWMGNEKREFKLSMDLSTHKSIHWFMLKTILNDHKKDTRDPDDYGKEYILLHAEREKLDLYLFPRASVSHYKHIRSHRESRWYYPETKDGWKSLIESYPLRKDITDLLIAYLRWCLDTESKCQNNFEHVDRHLGLLCISCLRLINTFLPTRADATAAHKFTELYVEHLCAKLEDIEGCIQKAHPLISSHVDVHNHADIPTVIELLVTRYKDRYPDQCSILSHVLGKICTRQIKIGNVFWHAKYKEMQISSNVQQGATEIASSVWDTMVPKFVVTDDDDYYDRGHVDDEDDYEEILNAFGR